MVNLADRLRLDPALWLDVLNLRRDNHVISALRSSARRQVRNWSRQTGKTTTEGIEAVAEAVLWPGSTVLLGAPGERQANLGMRDASRFFRMLPEELRLGITAESESRLEMGNESLIVSLPGVESVRGYAPTHMSSGRKGRMLVFIDEAAWAEDDLLVALAAVTKHAPGGGRFIVQSCPNWKRGREGFFWRLCEGDEGEAWERSTVTIDDAGGADADWLAAQRSSMTSQQFEAEYYCRFADVVDTRLLDPADVRAMFVDGVRKAVLGVRWPESTVSLFVDLAQAVDYTAFVASAMVDGKVHVVWHERMRGLSYVQIAEHTKWLLGQAPFRVNTKVGVDYTGQGRPVVDMMREMGVRLTPVLFTGGDGERVDEDGTIHIGKETFLGNIQVASQQRRVVIPADITGASTLRNDLRNLDREKHMGDSAVGFGGSLMFLDMAERAAREAERNRPAAASVGTAVSVEYGGQRGVRAYGGEVSRRAIGSPYFDKPSKPREDKPREKKIVMPEERARLVSGCVDFVERYRTAHPGVGAAALDALATELGVAVSEADRLCAEEIATRRQAK